MVKNLSFSAIVFTQKTKPVSIKFVCISIYIGLYILILYLFHMDQRLIKNKGEFAVAPDSNVLHYQPMF